MINPNIEKLLKARETDEKLLKLEQTLKQKEEKKEEAKKAVESTKERVTKLEEEAKKIQAEYQNSEIIVNKTLAEINNLDANDNENLARYEDLHTQLINCESGLSNIEARLKEIEKRYDKINDDGKEFFILKKKLEQEYEKLKNDTAPEIQKLEKDFNEAVKGVDEKLKAKYHEIRNIPKPIALMEGKQYCPVCGHDVSKKILDLIKTDGWACCDNDRCNRIIYQE